MVFDLLLILYVVGCLLGLWFIFQDAGVQSWKALIPIYNIVVWIHVCGKSWKWYVYFLIPAINVFTFLLLVVETAKCYRRYGFWEQTLAVLFPFIYLPFLGINKRLSYTHPSKLPPYKISQGRDWLEAIVFALVAAVIIRGNIFEFYNIPSSSMEKSLMTGDYLMVSKMAYGPRNAMTPFSFPLVHNVLPLTKGNVESYLRWPQLPYHRYPGLGKVKRFDATVFNYPDGDTVCTAFQSNRSYHDLVRKYGRERVMTDREHFGKVKARPVSKKENFIKRTIGLPGETLEIRDRAVYINGECIQTPKDAQFTYIVRMHDNTWAFMQSLTQVGMNVSPQQAQAMKLKEDAKVFAKYGVSQEDWLVSNYYMYLPVDSAQLETILNYRDYWSIDVLHPFKGATQPFLARLAPDYGVSVNETEYTQRDMQLQQNLQQMTSELLAQGMSQEILVNTQQYYTLPLTEEKFNLLLKDPAIADITPVVAFSGYSGLDLFPHATGYSWSVDNLGPVTIPAKGKSIGLDKDNVELYRRAIVNYEHNTLLVRGDTVFINGKRANAYTFKMDYYWEMGDNRHNSVDSRYWGFVPEDHIVGKATWIVWSKDKEKASFPRVRWNRTMRHASRY
ncbi:MAG: signal peptidase I [Bacteroidales bacterium]|nr:signal peptidase I [Bacteroidales bacterium]